MKTIIVLLSILAPLVSHADYMNQAPRWNNGFTPPVYAPAPAYTPLPQPVTCYTTTDAWGNQKTVCH